MQWIDHAGIRAKVALAPAILALLMVAIIIHGLMVIADNRASVERERLVSGHGERIAALSGSILTAKGNLYRLVSLASKEKDPAKIAQMSKDAMAELGSVLASLSVLEQSGAELGVDSAQVGDAVDKLKKFLTGARDVADMVTDDIGYALILTGAVDRKYEAAAQSFDKVEDTIAAVRARSAEDLISSMALARNTFIIGGVVAVALAAALTLFLSIRIAAPVKSLTDVVRRLSTREYETRVPHQELRDEVGEMARAVETLRKVGLEAVRLEAAHEQEQRQKEERAAKVDDRLHRFDAEVRDALSAMMGSSDRMRDITGTMAATAGETFQRAGLVAHVTTRTSENVNIMAGAAEELMASIGEISRQVEHSTSIVAEAVGHVAEATVMANGLSDEARKINDVVELINAIAKQTNLLALNATIEAARAGESGKGFAVVAHEVKNLANQTAGATDQIAQEIAAVQKAAATVVETIEGVSHTIERMSAIATAVAAAIQEQGAATGEISRSIKEVSDGTREVGSAVSEMSEAARGSESAGHQVRDAAVHLSDRATLLQTNVSAFLAEVSAI